MLFLIELDYVKIGDLEYKGHYFYHRYAISTSQELWMLRNMIARGYQMNSSWSEYKTTK